VAISNKKQIKLKERAVKALSFVTNFILRQSENNHQQLLKWIPDLIGND